LIHLIDNYGMWWRYFNSRKKYFKQEGFEFEYYFLDSECPFTYVVKDDDDEEGKKRKATARKEEKIKRLKESTDSCPL
jgi:hypothetical protein